MPDGADPRPARGAARAYRGPVRLGYAPEADGRADPGEVVWAWVPYEDDPRLGKDRPLLVIGLASGDHQVALMLSSRDHTDEPGWTPLGAGPWDARGRMSWVCHDRVFELPDGEIRREGAVLPPERFRAVLDRIRRPPG